MSYLKKIDHVSYAIEKGNIEKWAWFHIEVEGGVVPHRSRRRHVDQAHRRCSSRRPEQQHENLVHRLR